MNDYLYIICFIVLLIIAIILIIDCYRLEKNNYELSLKILKKDFK